MKKLFSIMSNIETHYHFKLDFHIVDQHTGGKYIYPMKYGRSYVVLCFNGYIISYLGCTGIYLPIAFWFASPAHE